MATFTMNMNKLPAFEAIDDNYSFDKTTTDNLELNVLDNDFPGFGSIEIHSVTDIDTEANLGSLSMSLYQQFIIVTLNDPGNITPGTYTFKYEIKDSFSRLDEALVTITIPA